MHNIFYTRKQEHIHKSRVLPRLDTHHVHLHVTQNCYLFVTVLQIAQRSIQNIQTCMQRSLNMFHILELVKCAHYLILTLKLKSKLQTNFTRQQCPSIVVST